MQSQVSIDWFTGVKHFAHTHPFPLIQDDFCFVASKGWSGYDVGERELTTDIKRFYSTTRPDMGFAVLLSGGALDSLAAMEPKNDLLAQMWRYGCREYNATRLDLAVDLFDGGELAHKCAKSVRLGWVKTKARKMSVIEQTRGGRGMTSYIGSRGSTRFMRVYDKNAESKGKTPTSRFELQCNKRFAAQMWRQINVPSQDCLNGVAYAAINGLVSDWGVSEINEHIRTIVSAKPEPKPAPNEDKWLWLSTQVLPTLRRDFYEKEEGAEALIDRLRKAIAG